MASLSCLSRARLGVSTFRLSALAFGLALTISAAMAVTPASAQGFGWFGKFFGGSQPRPAPQADAPSFDRHADGFHTRQRQRATASLRALHEKDRLPPKNASLFVYVIGDALGQNLAFGLSEALADRQDVAIIQKAKGPTGLAATDVFDWRKAVGDMLADIKISTPSDALGTEAAKGDAGRNVADKRQTNKLANGKTSIGADPHQDRAPADLTASNPINATVMMIGSNDWQAIRLDKETLKPGTPEWAAEYRKRIATINEGFRRKGVPLIWVGVPIARNDGFADEMAALNDMYREAAAKSGTVYVDTWEAFSDDNGEFRAVGPDINGQMTRLRTPDGIYFTKAGSRKLAHFVEIHVRRALDGKMARPPMPETPSPSVILMPKRDVGPISNLIEPPLSRGGRLADAYDANSEAETTIVRGSPQSAPAGRADDLKWPSANTTSP